MPRVDALYAFLLTGYAAATRDYNFPDWDFYINHGNNWANSTLDLAGGGQVSDDGQTLIKAGDYSLYNMAWPADSTVAILDHWKKRTQIRHVPLPVLEHGQRDGNLGEPLPEVFTRLAEFSRMENRP